MAGLRNYYRRNFIRGSGLQATLFSIELAMEKQKLKRNGFQLMTNVESVLQRWTILKNGLEGGYGQRLRFSPRSHKVIRADGRNLIHRRFFGLRLRRSVAVNCGVCGVCGSSTLTAVQRSNQLIEPQNLLRLSKGILLGECLTMILFFSRLSAAL